MNFLNTLSSWWQWAILAAIPPAIVLLYFLKLKRKPVEVPSTYLWRKSIEDLHVNTIWQRLRRNLLLFLQLLVLLVAILAVLRPSWKGEQLIGQRFIFLVDNSASMQATDVVPSRLEEAKRLAIELIDKMKAGDVGMVVSFCDAARVEQAFTFDRWRLRRAVEEIRPTRRSTSLAEALKVAAGLANPGRTSQDVTDYQVAEALPADVYIISDGKFGAVEGFSLGNLTPYFVAVGEVEARNVAVAAFDVARSETHPDLMQAFARLENYGPEPAAVSAALLLDGTEVGRAEDTIDPGGTTGVSFPLEAAKEGVLQLVVSEKDDFELDDVAHLILSPPRRSRVLLVTPGNEPLELALQTDSAMELAELEVAAPAFLGDEKYVKQAVAGTWDLVIYDRCRPKQMPRANTLMFGAVPPGGGWSAGEKVDLPQIIPVGAVHPLMQWIDLGDVLVVEATPLTPPPGADALIDSDAGALMAMAPREGYEDAVLGFVLIGDAPGGDGKSEQYVGTNWMTRQSFPVFVYNLFSYLGGAAGRSGVEPVLPGESFTLEHLAPGAKVTIESPGGSTTTGRAGEAGTFTFSDTDELGVYQVGVGGKPAGQFAVNLFHPRESDVPLRKNPRTELPSIRIGYVEVEGQRRWEPARREIWRELLLVGLLVLGVEWYIYNRRVAM